MAISSKKVFLSSGVIYAFIDRAHPQYPQAAAYFRYFAQEKYHVFTGYIQIIDAYKDVYERISPSLAKDFLKAIMLGSVNIIYPTESDIKAALKTLINYKTTELTLRESQMAVLANRYSIPQICTIEYLHPLFGLNTFYLPI